MSGETCEVFVHYGDGLLCGDQAVVLESMACVHEHLRRTHCCRYHAHPRPNLIVCRPCLLADGHACQLQFLGSEPPLEAADAS